MGLLALGDTGQSTELFVFVCLSGGLKRVLDNRLTVLTHLCLTTTAKWRGGSGGGG